jgi:hypothetical protein
LLPVQMLLTGMLEEMPAFMRWQTAACTTEGMQSAALSFNSNEVLFTSPGQLQKLLNIDGLDLDWLYLSVSRHALPGNTSILSCFGRTWNSRKLILQLLIFLSSIVFTITPELFSPIHASQQPCCLLP